MRLLRPLADLMIDSGFHVAALHCTRSENQLTDEGTRLASPQDFRPFLAPEGFNAASCRGTVATFPAAAHASVISTSQILLLQLGRRAQWRWNRRLGRL